MVNPDPDPSSADFPAATTGNRTTCATHPVTDVDPVLITVPTRASHQLWDADSTDTEVPDIAGTATNGTPVEANQRPRPQVRTEKESGPSRVYQHTRARTQDRANASKSDSVSQLAPVPPPAGKSQDTAPTDVYPVQKLLRQRVCNGEHQFLVK